MDYAGLFPPAALEMEDAVARYARYVGSDERWMLGRFILPVARLDEFVAAAGARVADLTAREPAQPWRLSVLAGPDDAAAIEKFNRDASPAGRWVIDTVETKAADIETIWRLATAFDAHHTVFVEVPVVEDPTPLIGELALRGLRAKIRTGGVTPDVFPSPEQVMRFLTACARLSVPFKATAGLHHPLRGQYGLTYESNTARGTMYGFLNVFLAAVLLFDGTDESELLPLLEEGDAAAIEVHADSLSWRGHSVSTEEIARARASFAVSFGSCSFEEPVADLAALGLLASASASDATKLQDSKS
ncbi:MAG TPA: hypothetical protein VFM71_07620 [Gemmatimonadaceae bacterium]|nr:hypothetical protein [Gemmatimonadaceae bacterium]